MNKILTGLVGILTVGALVYFGYLKYTTNANGSSKLVLIQDSVETANGDARTNINTGSPYAAAKVVLTNGLVRDGLSLLVTSPVDAQAVVKDINGKARVVSIGDEVVTGAFVIHINNDKIVLNYPETNETSFLFLVDRNGNSKIQTLVNSAVIQNPTPLVPLVD